MHNSQTPRARGDRHQVEGGDRHPGADDGGDQDQLALAAHEQVGPVQGAVQRGAAQLAHAITAPAENSELRMLLANMISDTTSTSMITRRTNSLISPPNTRDAPATTMPIRLTA